MKTKEQYHRSANKRHIEIMEFYPENPSLGDKALRVITYLEPCDPEDDSSDAQLYPGYEAYVATYDLKETLADPGNGPDVYLDLGEWRMLGQGIGGVSYDQLLEEMLEDASRRPLSASAVSTIRQWAIKEWPTIRRECKSDEEALQHLLENAIRNPDASYLRLLPPETSPEDIRQVLRDWADLTN